MDTRTDKNTGDTISLLGFGCMRLPVIDGKSQCIDKSAAQQMVDYALAHGVNYFDTAYPYHMGASESFVGEAMSRYPRGSYHLASKMPLFSLKTRKDVERIFQEQLGKCRTDYFDFYLMHSVNETLMGVMEKFDVYRTLKKEQKRGRIRRLGFSFHGTLDVLERLVEQYEFDFAQIQLNYLDWELQNARRQYEILTERGIPVIVMEPVRGGALASLNEAARGVFQAAGINNGKNGPSGQDAPASLASWALRFCASLPNVLCILSGMTTMEQLQDNLATLSGFQPLSKEEYAVIEQALTAYKAAGAVPCTGCGYCMECPSGVDIPRVFGLYNEWQVSHQAMGYWIGLELIGEGKWAQNCTDCGHCLELCPQQIAIPERMKEITEGMKELRL